MHSYDFSNYNPKRSNVLPEDTKALLQISEIIESDHSDIIFRNYSTGTEYLKLKLIVLEYEGKRSDEKPIIYQMIGLKGKNGNIKSKFAVNGRNLLKDIIEQGREVTMENNIDTLIKRRLISKTLNQLKFHATLKLEKDPNGEYPDKNSIKSILVKI